MPSIEVLLVEDNPEHQRIIRSQLIEAAARVRDEPLHVTVAKTGKRFLNLAKCKRFDCVLLDYNLPDSSADELLSIAATQLGDCPTIVISCSDSQEAAVKCFRSGTVDFIPKTDAFVGGALFRRIDAAVNESRQRIAKRKEAEHELTVLQQLTETDQLTGLHNRRFFHRFVSETPEVTGQGVGACLLVDLDHFKSVNDQFGHPVGDDVLKAVSDLIRRQLRSCQAAIRWGGEEFLILKPEATQGQAWIWAERILSAARQMIVSTGGRELGITLSAGLAWPTADNSYAGLVEMADQALYLAKSTGRDRVCTWPMVFAQQVLNELDRSAGVGVEKLWFDFVSRISPVLGPVQREHVVEHCRIVSQTAADLAEDVGLPAHIVDQVRQAGLLHDVGKSLVPEDLLAKAIALLPEEKSVVGKHAEFSADIARQLGASDEVVECVGQHHRPYNQELSTATRVLSIADAWVAMTSVRGYRSSQSAVDALNMLQSESGLRYDPDIVRHVVERPMRAVA